MDVINSAQPLDNYLLVVLNHDGTLVLLIRHGHIISFPKFELTDPPYISHELSQRLSAYLKHRIDKLLTFNLLYCSFFDDDEPLLPRKICIFECLTPVTTTEVTMDNDRWRGINNTIDNSNGFMNSRYEWFPVSQLEQLEQQFGLEWKRPVQDETINMHAIHVAIQANQSERVWERCGWFTDISEKATAVLCRLKYTKSGGFIQHSISLGSIILFVETQKGRVYLKGSNAPEGSVMKYTSKIAPSFVPSPLYVEEKEKWFLMEDYGQTLESEMTWMDAKTILDSVANLQMASMDHVTQLKQLGLRVENPKSIEKRARRMLQEQYVVTNLNLINGCDHEQTSTYYIDVVETFLTILYVDLDLPMTLVHGDLHGNQITKKQTDTGVTRYSLFDWGCAYIGIAFDDCHYLHSHITSGNEDNPNVQDSYLRFWEKRYGPLENLQQAVECLRIKHSFLITLECYENAKKRRLYPCLNEGDMIFLYRSVMDMKSKSTGVKQRKYGRLPKREREP